LPETIKALCVYCGSNTGGRDAYAQAARGLGRLLATNGIGLVYGGAGRGLMGVIADEVLAAGGKVQGVIPKALLTKEIAHPRLDALHVVHSMHERKSMMAELSDGFVALPGGFGTLEEIVEMLTWAQLGIHTKPCGLLNVGGYYDGLLAYFDHAVAELFVKPAHREMLLVDANARRLLAKFREYAAPPVGKWLD
jgi:uncharacterized protein (TIGR00730 family)